MSDKNKHHPPQSPPQNIEDHIPEIKGKIVLTAKNVKTGEKKVIHEDKNMVVKNLRYNRVRLLGGSFLPVGDSPTRYIGQIGFGTSGTAETEDDSSLTGMVTATIGTVTYPASNSVKFTGTLGSTVGNGVVFREAGLLFIAPAPYLATRVTFSAMEKSSMWQWEVSWTLILL